VNLSARYAPYAYAITAMAIVASVIEGSCAPWLPLWSIQRPGKTSHARPFKEVGICTANVYTTPLRFGVVERADCRARNVGFGSLASIAAVGIVMLIATIRATL
jgi:hypothetical protein